MSVGFVGTALSGALVGAKQAWFFGSETPAFAFDCVVRESHSSELTVTENPVETGVVIADHAFMNPLRLEIEAVVGEIWLHSKDASGADVPDVDWLRGGQSTRPVTAFDLLQQLQESAEPFSVQTVLRLYTNMVVKTLSTDQDKDSVGVLHFRAGLCEVKRVSTETVTFTPRQSGKATRQGAKPTNGGTKSAQQVADVSKAATFLKGVVGKDFNADNLSLGAIGKGIGGLLGLGD